MESYHVGQLIPFVDRRYRTVARREGRAIAGLSMGGFGTMSYAARHPDTFGAAASFSGAVDLTNAALRSVVGGDGAYGAYRDHEVRWRGRNPVNLAANLRSLRLAVRTGNGQPGGPLGGGADGVEVVCHAMSTSLHRRLRRLGIAHVWDAYGPGAHTWPYWGRELSKTLPYLMRGFARPRPRPASVSFRAIESRFTAWGWRVAIGRPALEFAELRRARRSGFEVRGSGSAKVTTARLYRPGAVVSATVRSARGVRRMRLRADAKGRLRIAFRLGRGNPAQQYAPGSTTRVFRTRVAIRP